MVSPLIFFFQFQVGVEGLIFDFFFSLVLIADEGCVCVCAYLNAQANTHSYTHTYTHTLRVSGMGKQWCVLTTNREIVWLSSACQAEGRESGACPSLSESPTTHTHIQVEMSRDATGLAEAEFISQGLTPPTRSQ